MEYIRGPSFDLRIPSEFFKNAVRLTVVLLCCAVFLFFLSKEAAGPWTTRPGSPRCSVSGRSISFNNTEKGLVISLNITSN